MPRSKRFVALGTFVFAAHAAAPILSAHPEPRGIWALEGSTLHHEVLARARGAPGRRSAVRADAHGLTVYSGSVAVTMPVRITPGLAEVVWAPGTRQVAINASDSGAIGTWDTYVVGADGTGPVLPVRQLVEARLGKAWACAGTEAANIGTVGWDRDGALLVIAEAPPRPGCANGGAILGLRIDGGRRVVTAVLPDTILRQRWAALLGSRFRALQ